MSVRWIVRCLAVVAALAVASPALGQRSDELRVRIHQAELAPDGSTSLVVSITGAAAAGHTVTGADLRVVDAGVLIDGLTVAPLLESDPAAVSVILAVDVSGSTIGAPLEAAREGAQRFVEDITSAGGQVGLVAFGPTAQVLAPLSSDAATLSRALDGLAADGETALYDGVELAVEQVAGLTGVRSIIVFSDGADTVSTATLDAVTAAAVAAEVPVTTVALATDALDPAAISELAAATGGRVIEASDSSDLLAAFTSAAQEVASTYRVTYAADPSDHAEVDVSLTATVAGAVASDTVTVGNPRTASPAGPLPSRVPEPLVEPAPWVLWAGIGAAFLAVAILLLVVVVAVRREAGSRRLQRTIGAYAGGVVRDRDLGPSTLSRQAVGLIERLPKPAGFDAALQHRIDRAAWPLRSSEFIALQAGSALVAAILGWAVTGQPLFVAVGGAVGFLVPRVVLDRRIQQRADAFLEQLPDTLGLLAGSLKAGYGLLQALDTVVQESPSPTSEEFARVLTETRLGLSVPEALEGMADRIDNEDFRWVVMAINIQAEVGGNLAQLLQTVATTLRGREEVRREVRTLAAEGKLSAYILVGLVPLMGTYMLTVNREYVSLLWTTSTGRMMSLVGLGLMAVGIAGIKKVITIDV